MWRDLLKSDPEGFLRALKRRNATALGEEVLAQGGAVRKAKARLQVFQNERNERTSRVAQTGEGERAQLLEELKELKSKIQRETEQLREREQKFQSLLARVPNLPDPEVPVGASEEDNVELRRWGTPKPFPKNGFPQYALTKEGSALAVAMSGSRFSMLSGSMATLYRAIGQWMTDQHVAHGFEEYSVPHIVKQQAVYGTGQWPHLQDDLYNLDGDSYLIPTGEVPLVNTVAGKLLPSLDAPLRRVALSPCYRREAGAAGKDTRGIIRLHQFYKVELVSICREEDSSDEHRFLLARAEAILQALELPYRVVDLCDGDLGFSAARTYDLEVWMPSQNTYREISSVSNCRAFQSSRMGTRYRSERGNLFAHTLNGSGLAVDRTLAAILENYQTQDGRVAVPKALQSHFHHAYL